MSNPAPRHQATAHIPLALRIVAYLRRTAAPQHYMEIAHHLHAAHGPTERACRRLWHLGRLARRRNGLYAVPQPQENAS